MDHMEENGMGVNLAWCDVSVYAAPTRGKKQKRLINNATGVVKAGALVALMGPSGAGKSTLMQALAHRNARGITVDGDIVINGNPIGEYVRKISGFMDQQDLFVDSLTVREHLHFMARMKLPRTTKRWEIRELADDYIVKLGLVKCADNRIGGDDNHKVLSGGERKRLACATEMLTNPALLFCDEPTTGLDSYSALTLVNLMKLMAESGKTIVCTIHQPSSELFGVFHQLILLTEGRIAYIGRPAGALQFFAERGYQCPANFNPADFFIRCLALTPGDELASRSKIKAVCDEFTVSPEARKIEKIVQEQLHTPVADTLRVLSKGNGPGPIWTTKLWLLTQRSFMEVVRDPSVQALRILQKILLGLMIGLCFVGSLVYSQSGVQAIQGAIFLFVTENTFGAMYSIMSMFPSERPLFMREYKNGLYSPQLYYISKMAALLPGLIVEPVVFTVILYWVAGLRSTSYAFFMSVVVVTLTMNVATACGCFFSNAFDSLSVAMACLVPFDYVLMITSGLFIKLSSMPDIIGWLKYLSWLMYSSEALSILQWDGIQQINCTANPELPCRHSGLEVLERFDYDTSHLNADLIAMCILYLIFHGLGFACLFWRAKANK